MAYQFPVTISSQVVVGGAWLGYQLKRNIATVSGQWPNDPWQLVSASCSFTGRNGDGTLYRLIMNSGETDEQQISDSFGIPGPQQTVHVPLWLSPIYPRMKNIAIRRASGTGSSQLYSTQFIINLNYRGVPQVMQISNAAISSNIFGPGATGTVTWTGHRRIYNALVATSAYLVHDGQETELPGVTYTTNDNNQTWNCSLNFTAPTTAGKYQIKIAVVGEETVHGEDNLIGYHTLDFTVYNALPAPNIRIAHNTAALAQASNIAYIGQINTPTQLVLSWDGAIAGATMEDWAVTYNNPLVRYQWRAVGDNIWTQVALPTTEVTIPVRSSDTVYEVRAIGQYIEGVSGQGQVRYMNDGVVIRNQPQQSDTGTTTDIAVAWTINNLTGAPDDKINIISSVYLQGESDPRYTGTDTSTTLSIDWFVASRRTQVTIQVRFESIYGGYVETTQSFHITSNRQLAEFNIVKIYDPDEVRDAADSNYLRTVVFDRMCVEWTASSSMVPNASITYRVETSSDGMSWTPRGNAIVQTDSQANLTTTLQVIGANGIIVVPTTEVRSFQLRIHATDGHTEKYVQYANEDNTPINVAIARLPSTPTNLQVTANQNNQVIVHSSGSNAQQGATYEALVGLRCEGMSENDFEFFPAQQCEANITGTCPVAQTLPITLTQNADGLSGSLYSLAIVQGYGKPSGQCKLVVRLTNFPKCSSATIADFTYDFTRGITQAALLGVQRNGVAVQPTNRVGNPGDGFTLTNPKNLVIYDAVGNAIAGNDAASPIKFSYTLTHQGNTIATDAASVDVVLPPATSTTDLQYQLTSTVTYKDNCTVEATSFVTLKVYRWTSQLIRLINVIGDTTKIQSTIVLPPKNPFSAANCVNLKQIDYQLEIILAGATSQFISGGQQWLPGNGNDFNRLTETVFETALSGDYSVRAKVTATNTSDQSLVAYSPIVSVRATTVDAAIRKNRFGINVGNNFGISANENEAALTIYARPDKTSAPALALFTNESATPIMQMYCSGVKVSDMSTITKNGIDYLSISKLHSSNAAFDALALTALDIAANGGSTTITCDADGRLTILNGLATTATATNRLLGHTTLGSLEANQAAIKNTLKLATTQMGSSPSLVFARKQSVTNNAASTMGQLYMAQNGALTIRTHSYQDNTSYSLGEHYQTYTLPAVAQNLTTNPTYAILNSKQGVAVAYGGTGASTPKAARANLGISEIYYSSTEPTLETHPELKIGDLWLKPMEG